MKKLHLLQLHANERDDDVKPQVAGIKRQSLTKCKWLHIDKVYNKISSQQAESERIFAELEEKRIKLDHEMLKRTR